MKILIKLPSRNRPERFFKALDSIVENIQDKENYMVSATLDTDDITMNRPEIIERISNYQNVSVEWGLSKSKIHAVNRSMPKNYNWDILMVGSDDIYFNFYGFDSAVRAEMGTYFPDGDGYLHFMEKDTMEFLNVMTVCDRKYYNRFNYIYHPSYFSLWCDNEQTMVAKMLKKYIYIPYEIMVHRNPAYMYEDCPRDDMFDEQQSHWGVDEKNYHERQKNNFYIK